MDGKIRCSEKLTCHRIFVLLQSRSAYLIQIIWKHNKHWLIIFKFFNSSVSIVKDKQYKKYLVSIMKLTKIALTVCRGYTSSNYFQSSTHSAFRGQMNTQSSCIEHLNFHSISTIFAYKF